jgi:uncharacterized protein (DUF1810 family)
MTSAKDPHNLQRLVDAQEPAFAEVCLELLASQNRSHWMWFIFPQMRGLGHSELANYYGISSRHEAEADLAHPVLEPRIRECTRLVTMVDGRSIDQILGDPDNPKFRSSMTLFASTGSENQIFRDALQKYFDCKPDQLTIKLL